MILLQHNWSISFFVTTPIIRCSCCYMHMASFLHAIYNLSWGTAFLNQFIEQLRMKFELLPLLSFGVSVEVQRFFDGLFLIQFVEASNLFNIAQMQGFFIPWSQSNNLPEALLSGLQYLIFTRPDISFFINYAAMPFKTSKARHSFLTQRSTCPLWIQWCRLGWMSPTQGGLQLNFVWYWW